ncbi:endo-1,4-beta-xylanase [Microbacterium sp. SLBN-146]|uniref:endo-1,4-beta-xylanase n=1 Tax=Microbacterium sp. SLBN-146 TaxID=2768457 RepID=UPI001174C3F4|nr:endo-1,4-beta-xylanase [Microbacterium sp. SLBN-146]TQJ30752.1 GH35 family endo-1,4-beta-xylanase [Microbacterium sp. SLBN-146]
MTVPAARRAGRWTTSIAIGVLASALALSAVTAASAADPETRLKDTAPFRVGVAIDQRETSGDPGRVVTEHFDQVTAENHMKPDAWYDGQRTLRIHPQAAAIVDFADERGLDVYGHTLVWHNQTPAWFFQTASGQPLSTSDADRSILRERMRTHIFGVARLLSERDGLFGAGNPLTAFDVVNEVISDGPEADGLRRSEWYRVLGEEFIDLAFRYADEAFNETYAAPDTDRPVVLFINDYSTEWDAKRARYLALVDRLLARGVPVDGVGHQFHVSMSLNVAALARAIDAFADRPVTQAVTEFDVPTGTPVTTAALDAQGAYYRAAFEVFHARKDHLYSVSVWGLNDSRSWRAADGAPLMFFDDLTAKPALVGALAAAPAPAVAVAASSRCVGGRVVLVVTSTNLADAAKTLQTSSAFGGRDFSDVASGRSVAHALSTRAVSIPAGGVTVTAEGGATVSALYPAVTCSAAAPR